MNPGFFVTGTDTDCGKTLVSAALIRQMVARGWRVAAMKPVASGAVMDGEGRYQPDVRALEAACNVAAPAAWVNPYAFDPPVAPHLAAERTGVCIEFERIVQGFQHLAGRADLVVVEGAGGWRTPLGPDGNIAALAVRLGLPVILVVGVRLGCINHAILTADAIRQDGARLAGWVANLRDPGMAALADNLTTLDRLLGAPRLACLPVLANPEEATAHDWFDGPLMETRAGLVRGVPSCLS